MAPVAIAVEDDRYEIVFPYLYVRISWHFRNLVFELCSPHPWTIESLTDLTKPHSVDVCASLQSSA
jgi:hypothetical protein